MADVDIIPRSCITMNGIAPRSSAAGLYDGINISPERLVTADVPCGILVSIRL